MTQINVEAIRQRMRILARTAREAAGDDLARVSQIEEAQRGITAALDELELAQPVVALIGQNSSKRGDEICVYATADDVVMISRAVNVL